MTGESAPNPRSAPETHEEREIAAIALGGNLGRREEWLAEARRRIADRMGEVVNESAMYETDPIGPPGQAPYLNQVVVIETTQPPEVLLEIALAIEAELGRERRERWGPRTIDLDLLLYGNVALDGCGLTLPHPRLHERPFVLFPLADVLPDWVHPRRGTSVREMRDAVGNAGVRRLANPSAGLEG